jgi:hypothetical protein
MEEPLRYEGMTGLDHEQLTELTARVRGAGKTSDLGVLVRSVSAAANARELVS